MRFEFTDDEIARMTAKKNARLRAKFPLLSYAGLLEEVTPADARASWDAINKRWQETEARLVARAAEFCEQVCKRLGVDETARLYLYRALPKSARRGTTPTSGAESCAASTKALTRRGRSSP